MTTALATRSHVAHASHVAQAPVMLTGMHLVPAGPCQLAGAVGADDVLRVDFDCRDVRADGLYLVEVPAGLRVAGRVAQVYRAA